MNWKSSRPDLVMLAVVILLAVLITGGYMAFSEIYGETPGGADFIGRWQAAKNLIYTQSSPLSEDTTIQINVLMEYRQAADWKENTNFYLPYFSILPFLPFGLITEILPATALWAVFSLICLVGVGLLSVKLSGWTGNIFTWSGFILLLGFGFPFCLAVWNGDLALFASILLLLTALLLKNGQIGYAGVLFGLAIIKPPLVVLVYPFVLLWALFRGRWVFLINSLGTILILSGVSWLLDPDWMMAFLRQIIAVPGQLSPTSTLQIFGIWFGENGKNLSYGLSIILGLYLLLEWVISFLNDEHHFLWTLGLTIVVSTMIGFPTDLDHQILFLFPILLIAAAWEKRWKVWGKWLTLGFMLLLLAANWGLVIGLSKSDNTDAILWIYFSMPAVLLVGLIWTRWWFLRLIELPGERWRSIHKRK